MAPRGNTQRPQSNDAYCRHCRYDLRSVRNGRCPECGRTFDLHDPTTYRRVPGFDWAKFDLPRRLRRAAVMVLVAILFLSLFSLVTGSDGYTREDVCKVCGKMRRTRNTYIPFLGITIWSSKAERDTPLSEELSERKLIADHEHQWHFCHGRERRIVGGGFIADGSGGSVASACHVHPTRTFIRDLQRFAPPAVQAKLIARLLDPDDPAGFCSKVAFQFPSEGVNSAAEFNAWLTVHGR